MEDCRMKKIGFGKVVYVLGIILCVLCIVCSGTYLVQYHYNRMEENRLIEEIQERKEQQQEEVIEEPIEEYSSEEIVNEEKQILSEYKSLYEENNDLYGWIKIEDTVIDYPVMFTPEDPNFYENRNWNKEVCNVGTTIFIDGRTADDSENIIVYGHNMRDFSMFGSLKYYKDKEYYEEHKYIEFDTIYEKATYEIIAVSKAKIYYNEEPSSDEYLFYMNIELDSEDEFDEYINNMKSNSEYDIEATAQYGDQLITLCTCDKYTTDGRLLVVAKKI